jgi:hypothetical protein
LLAKALTPNGDLGLRVEGVSIGESIETLFEQRRGGVRFEWDMGWLLCVKCLVGVETSIFVESEWVVGLCVVGG